MWKGLDMGSYKDKNLAEEDSRTVGRIAVLKKTEGNNLSWQSSKERKFHHRGQEL